MDGGPLAGVRIVEIASYVAGPLAGLMCAQLGAEVIRIDPPGGAPDTKRWPLAPTGTSLYWTGLNKGKRSVVIDLRREPGQRLLGRLLAASGPSGGIVITNAPPRPGTDVADLRAVRPDLIHVQIVGRSDGGPAVDYTVNAGSGFAEVTGPRGFAGVVNHVLPAWDLCCGLHAALGVITALRHRERTGFGQQVRLALEDVAIAMSGHLGFLAEAELGARRERSGNDVFGTYGIDFATADGRHVIVVALTPRHWQELGERTGLGATLDGIAATLGIDVADEGERFRHRDVLSAVLRPWFGARSADEIDAAFAGAPFPWAWFRTFAEAARLARHRPGPPLLDAVDQPGVGVVHTPRSALRMSATPPGPARPAPELGADTRDVLGTLLDLSGAELDALTVDGTIAP